MPISALDGSIGSWSAGGNLPAKRAWGSLEVAGGTLLLGEAKTTQPPTNRQRFIIRLAYLVVTLRGVVRLLLMVYRLS